MTMARRKVVTEGAEGVYHCISRCFRQAFSSAKGMPVPVRTTNTARDG